MYMRLVLRSFPRLPTFFGMMEMSLGFYRIFPIAFVWDVHTLINLNSIHDVLICSLSLHFFSGSSQLLKTRSFQSYRDECHILFLFLSKVLLISGGNWRTFAKCGKTSKPCNSLPWLWICSTRKQQQQQHSFNSSKVEAKDSLMLIWDTYTKLW